MLTIKDFANMPRKRKKICEKKCSRQDIYPQTEVYGAKVDTLFKRLTIS
jgi:hypothetical protein